jgi:hypothetical protein
MSLLQLIPLSPTFGAMARENLVEIRIGRRFIYLTPDGREREFTRTQAYIEGRSEIQTEVKIEGTLVKAGRD